MQIRESTLTLAAAHHLDSSTTRQIQTGGGASATPFHALVLEDMQTLQARGRAVAPAAASDPPAAPDATTPEAKLQALLKLLFDQDDAAAPPSRSSANAGGNDASALAAAAADGKEGSKARPAGPSLRGPAQLMLLQTRETESCSFSASGKICLADGSERQFDVNYRLERREEIALLAASGTLRDPLVLDLAAPDSRLGAHSVEFDLNADGTAESMRMPGETSAILFHDRNRNGMADDGSELFGPLAGDGFADLARLDSDKNGWIDSNDPAFADLKLWRMDADGQQHQESLTQAGIGALATRSAETPFSLKDDGETQGQMRASSVWLGEHSGAGSVRQIDMATREVKA